MNFDSWIKKQKIGVLYGGTSKEREISLKTGHAVLNALKEMKLNVVGIDVGRDVIQNILKEKITFAFIALHGPLGEDGTIQGALEILGIPYTGSGVLASVLALNKIYSKQIFKSNGIPTSEWIVVKKTQKKLPTIPFGYPVVVKPSSQGSTIGVNIVKNRDSLKRALKEAFKYNEEAIIEKYIPGRELTVGIIGDKVLPVMEIIPVGKYYDYTAKYVPGKSKHILPAPLPKKVYKRAQELAMMAFNSLNCKAVARVDMRYDGKNIYVLEVNTIPGMTETSLLPEAASYIGIDFKKLVYYIMKYSV